MEVMREASGRRRQERWIKHYSSEHHILLVGDGDFSFSACLAMAFRSATNIIATSLDSYDELMKKYKNARDNLAILNTLGACVLHGVDATTMSSHPHLHFRKFHRIIYNFPHAGFHRSESNPDLIMMHRNLVHGFFRNASKMLLSNGEIHVNHKITAPFDSWRIDELGSNCSLRLVGLDDFRIGDYPGYRNKRGSGNRSDEPFPLGECKTFMFQLLLPLTYNANYKDECLGIFGGYLNHVEETFGSGSYDHVRCSMIEALRRGFEAYLGAVPGRPLSGYVNVLEELHKLSILRSTRLRKMLLVLDQQHSSQV